MASKSKKVQIPIRMDDRLYDKSKIVVAEEDMSFNKYMVSLIKKDLLERGLIGYDEIIRL